MDWLFVGLVELCAEGCDSPGWMPAQALTRSSTLRYHSDTVRRMAMTLRLTDREQESLRERAAQEGISMQEAARRAIREYVARSEHRDRVSAAADLITNVHADAIDRLGR